jgi:3-dehydroquinate synthase
MERIVGGVTRATVGRGIVATVLEGLDAGHAVLCQPGSEHVARSIADEVHVLPDGEAAKSLGVVEEIVADLAAQGLRRDGAIVAVGGGALMDAAGFIAAVYLRGVEARYVPTTLLGAVDASIGGKNGINVAGKNLVGTFTHPARVVVDLDVVAALPRPLLVEGMAEVVKAGAIADGELLDAIGRDGVDTDLELVVERSIAVKADVVDADFTEQGRRAILNFGHTLGHGVEYLSGWSHGHSVAVGMVAACAASERLAGFQETERVMAALEATGLPTAAPGLDPDAVLELVAKDKKADARGIRMVLLEGIGRPTVAHVDSATLGAALAAIGIGGS